MRYTSSALLSALAAAAVVPISVAQFQQPLQTTTSSIPLATAPPAPVVQSFEKKCPAPLRNDKGCRCIPVEDYDDLKGAIERMDDGECKCFQPFSVTKSAFEGAIAIDDVRNMRITCQEFGQCEINGEGTHIEIEGERTELTLSGFRFLGATESAIVVKDETGTARKITREQKFCDNQFVNNENNWADGGAIKVGTSAKVYVGNSFFELNHAARMGGAISGEAAVLQVLDSSFKANTAAVGGAIATNKPEAVLVIGDCEFDNNAAQMGPSFGPAIAANGKVQDFGGIDVNPQDLMCLDCQLSAGTRIRAPVQPAAPPQVPAFEVPVVEQTQQQVPVEGNPLDTVGMEALLPAGQSAAAPALVVEEEAPPSVEENTAEEP